MVFMIHLSTKFEVCRPSNLADMPPSALVFWWPWPLTLDLGTGAHYCPCGGQPSYQLRCFWDVSFSTYGPIPVRCIMWPCDLTLEVMERRWYGRTSSICVPRLKLLGLLVRKVLHIFGRSGDLDLWPLSLNWCALVPMSGQPSTNFDVPGTFYSQLIGQHVSDHVTLRPWPFTLEIMALGFDMGLHLLSVYHVWNL